MSTVITLDSIPILETTCWTQGTSTESLSAFLAQNPPSTSKKGLDGWVWVRSGRHNKAVEEKQAEDLLDPSSQAAIILSQAERELIEIKEDKTRAKKGEKSKKQRQDEANKRFANKMREIAQGINLTCGKWLFFEETGNVDSVFKVLAHSIIDGPLSKLGNGKAGSVCCHTVKVANALEEGLGDKPGEGRVLCLYFDDCWNESHAKEVLTCLLRHHNMCPSACKPDLYTMINLMSGRPSGIRASVFSANALIPENERSSLRQKAEKESGLDSKGKRIVKAPSAKGAKEEDYDSETDSDDEGNAVRNSPKVSDKTAQVQDSDDSDGLDDSSPIPWKYVPKKTTSRSNKVLEESKSKSSTGSLKEQNKTKKSKLARELAEMNDESSEDEGVKRASKQPKREGGSGAKKVHKAVARKKAQSESATEESVTEEE